jgi:hypothetical protein
METPRRSGVAQNSVRERVHRRSRSCIALCNQRRRLRTCSVHLRHLPLPLTEHRTCADRGLPIHGTCRHATSLPLALGGRTFQIAESLRYSPEKIRHNSLALGLTALIPFFSGLSLRAPRCRMYRLSVRKPLGFLGMSATIFHMAPVGRPGVLRLRESRWQETNMERYQRENSPIQARSFAHILGRFAND